MCTKAQFSRKKLTQIWNGRQKYWVVYLVAKKLINRMVAKYLMSRMVVIFCTKVGMVVNIQVGPNPSQINHVGANWSPKILPLGATWSQFFSQVRTGNYIACAVACSWALYIYIWSYIFKLHLYWPFLFFETRLLLLVPKTLRTGSENRVFTVFFTRFRRQPFKSARLLERRDVY